MKRTNTERSYFFDQLATAERAFRSLDYLQQQKEEQSKQMKFIYKMKKKCLRCTPWTTHRHT